MASAENRLQKRRRAIAQFRQIFEQPNFVNVIHYSCESFYDRENGSSPRITSIAVKNLDNAQTKSFSIHLVAEKKHVSDQIETQYDDLEHDMLSEFYDFVQRHEKYLWLHWNMRDTNYGFPAIAHRYAVLGGEPISVDEQRLLDLARILIDKYGPQYIGHPRMQKIMSLNGISDKDALSGKEEAIAFEEKEYVKLHQSTLRKVDVLSIIAEREWLGDLKTKSDWKAQYGVTVMGIVEAVGDSTLFKLLGLLGIIITLVSFAIQILQLLQSPT